MGEKTFREVMAALTLKGTYNQGLSYFYVDFVDMISLVLKMIKRLGEMVKDQRLPKVEQEEVETWLERAKRQTEFSSEYLRHQFYGDIQKSSVNGYVCAQWALGQTCEHTHDFPEDHSLSLVLTNHCMLAFAIERVIDAVDHIHSTGSLKDEEYETLVDEIFSMIELAKLSYHEMLHYIKHLMRGWWQDTAIKELKQLMRDFPDLKGAVIDHKNKLLPRCFNEAMTMFFSKSGISILGAMIFWAGVKIIKGKEVHGLFVWFLDIVMENTTSQEARDLMPCLEAITSELSKDYFVNEKGAGGTKGLFILSDNALTAVAHTPFIHALNRRRALGLSECSSISPDIASSSSLLGNDNSTRNANDDSSQDTTGAVEKSNNQDCKNGNCNDSDGDDNGGDDDERGKSGETAVKTYFDSEQLRSRYRALLGNWDSNGVKPPLVIQWLNWEAQRCKTQLDTHFAYLNKQLAKACLEGGINYLDPKTVFEALSYKGGSTATTTLLLQELEQAHHTFEACDKAVKDRKGINSVHDIAFEKDKITHSFFSNLDTGKKVHVPTEEWPDCEEQVSNLLERNVNDREPNFVPFEVKDDNPEDAAVADLTTLPGRVSLSLTRESSDVAFAFDSEDAGATTKNKSKLQEREDMCAHVRKILYEYPELLEEYEMTFPVTLVKFWAQKKNRNYLKLSESPRRSPANCQKCLLRGKVWQTRLSDGVLKGQQALCVQTSSKTNGTSYSSVLSARSNLFLVGSIKSNNHRMTKTGIPCKKNWRRRERTVPDSCWRRMRNVNEP